METQDISEADTVRVPIVAAPDANTTEPMPTVEAPHYQCISIDRLFRESRAR